MSTSLNFFLESSNNDYLYNIIPYSNINYINNTLVYSKPNENYILYEDDAEYLNEKLFDKNNIYLENIYESNINDNKYLETIYESIYESNIDDKIYESMYESNIVNNKYLETIYKSNNI
tara:strand:+ start:12232 stop:12588 length:357 start_codon:yes stop_codon:yes gene_type:complete